MNNNSVDIFEKKLFLSLRYLPHEFQQFLSNEKPIHKCNFGYVDIFNHSNAHKIVDRLIKIINILKNKKN